MRCVWYVEHLACVYKVFAHAAFVCRRYIQIAVTAIRHTNIPIEVYFVSRFALYCSRLTHLLINIAFNKCSSWRSFRLWSPSHLHSSIPSIPQPSLRRHCSSVHRYKNYAVCVEQYSPSSDGAVYFLKCVVKLLTTSLGLSLCGATVPPMNQTNFHWDAWRRRDLRHKY